MHLIWNICFHFPELLRPHGQRAMKRKWYRRRRLLNLELRVSKTIIRSGLRSSSSSWKTWGFLQALLMAFPPFYFRVTGTCDFHTHIGVNKPQPLKNQQKAKDSTTLIGYVTRWKLKFFFWCQGGVQNTNNILMIECWLPQTCLVVWFLFTNITIKAISLSKMFVNNLVFS